MVEVSDVSTPQAEAGPPDQAGTTGPPPVTGNEAVDRALSDLRLGSDVTSHHDAIAAALDAVQRATNRPGGAQTVP